MGRVVESLGTGPSLGVLAVETFAEDEVVCAVARDVRVGLVSCGLVFLGLAALTVFEAALLEAERASGRLGEASREFKGEEAEEREVVVCCVAVFDSALFVDAAVEDARLGREGSDSGAGAGAVDIAIAGADVGALSLASASGKAAALFAVVAIFFFCENNGPLAVLGHSKKRDVPGAGRNRIERSR